MAKTREGDGYQEAQRRIAEAKRTNATEIKLSGLGLTTLPPEIGSLTAVQVLRLYDNPLTTLPPEIGSLTELNELYLSHSSLTTLPSEIGDLASLREAYLHSNKLSSLPARFALLSEMRMLTLGSNRFQSIPPEVFRLRNLTRLEFSDSQLKTLPAQIRHLSSLRILELYSNQLTALPAEIGSLSGLETLSLHGNQLTTLPAEIRSLSGLETLYLQSNQLTTLPPEIGQLRRLKNLYLHDNPDLGIPPEVLGPARNDISEHVKPKPPREILEYYFTHRRAAQEVGTEPLMEAKVLVLGEASVGKTCLIAALSENKPRDEVPEGGTSGIVRKHWPVRVDGDTIAGTSESPSAETLRLNLWDFGGQEIYHSAHTLFLTERAIYLIVISKRDNERQNNADYWLKMAASFGGPDAATYLVVNQIDEKVGHLPDEEALRRRHPHLRGFLYTSCDDLSGIPEVRRTVVKEALQLKGVRLPVARTWLAVKTKLETMEQHTLSMQEWEALCGQEDVSADDARRELLHLCDRLGTVRYFPAGQHASGQDYPPELCENAILNPEWVTVGIYALFDDEALKDRGGLLTRKQMAKTLSQRGYPADQERIIEEVMRRFNLLYDSAEHGEQHRMLIPVMLSQLEPALDWPKEQALEFVYQYTVMPAGLIPAFMARMHRSLSKTPSPWRHGCVLDINDCRARIIGDREQARTSVSVIGPEPSRRDALDHVRSVFDALHATVRDLGEEEKIPIPGHPDAPMLDYKHMRALEWHGEREFKARGSAPGELIPVDVAKTLGRYRGESRRKHDEEQRREQTSQTVVHGDLVYGDKQETRDDHNINIGGDVVNSQVGQTLTNCTNTIQQQAPGEKKGLLEELRDQVQELIEQLPEDKIEEAPRVAKNLEALVNEATSSKPDRKWYSLSADGLLEASRWTKDFAGNIVGTIGQLGKLIWPDFPLPDAE